MGKADSNFNSRTRKGHSMKTTKTDYKKWWSISRRKELALWIGVLLLGLVSVRSPSQTYTILHAFGTNTIGHNPYSTLVQGPDGMLYGTTDSGGVANRGQVFKVNPDGSGYTVLKDFTGSDGSGPDAGLVLSGTALYGTTSSGGTNDNGTVFKVNTDGTGFAVLKQFTGYDGANPYAKLMLSGAMLYGITAYGGYSDAGTVFKINTDGSSFANLYSFTARDPDTGTNNDGANPVAELILSGDILYGTTECGGCYGCGTVFAVNTDGSGFTNIYNFMGGSNGAFPFGKLLLSSNTLYGTTRGGDSSDHGTVFALKTDGTGFTTLYRFTNGSDGRGPMAGLILSGRTLYGTT
ncbi:MAG TPA: choice-of-anchor tandem repeat GloVer-containing protein, partial [Candidatus Acidoferrales bacterium]|nr:choice-of-anchor tandem repeat GloVer-containing protein [Candidatus Acidoferrales bacterium]